MKLRLERNTFTSRSSIGDLFVDGKFECHTLEDPERETKIWGDTAIPRGTYKVVISQSPRFRQLMPLLVDVPNFDGIRIHWGNHAGHTEGCPLVGRTKARDFVGQSRLAYAALFKKLEAAPSPIEIEITGPSTSSGISSAAAAKKERWFWVSSDTLNLRVKASGRSKILAALPHRHLLHSAASPNRGGWLSVETRWENKMLHGFVHASFLIEASVEAAIAVENLPTNPAEAATALAKLYEITASTLRLRSTASTASDSNVIAGLSQGEVVRRIGSSRSSAWWKVETTRRSTKLTGFVSAAFLRALPAVIGTEGSRYDPEAPAVLEHANLADPAGGAMVPEEAISLILRFEGLDQPGKWPGGQSGITIGHGYDLGYHSFVEFAGDWDAFLKAAEITALRSAIQITGRRAAAIVSRFTQIRIQKPWAEHVFLRRTLPKHRLITAQALPGIHILPALAQGALVSLIFNRGPGMSDPPGSDRRREMREVRAAVATADLPAIAAGIRSMKRIWRGRNLDGLIRRREAEAVMVETSA